MVDCDCDCNPPLFGQFLSDSRKQVELFKFIIFYSAVVILFIWLKLKSNNIKVSKCRLEHFSRWIKY